jgi:two-component sensor histidine kinase/DNA-binding response OmpR family regulator
MASDDKINILLVDDQPAKLLTYEAILGQLGETLIKANSAKEAFEQLLKTEIAIVLVDVCMPDLDGFQLAAMVREHPRFQKTAIIFVSAVLLADVDHLRGYEIGAVDYVPVPVIPEVLRAKVRVFAELYRKTRQLEALNRDLEQRVAERTAELEASTTRLLESEQRRSVALAAGQMGSWDWNIVTGECVWDDGQYRIFGVEPGAFALTFANIRSFIHPDDLQRIQGLVLDGLGDQQTFQTEARIIRPNGETRWCICAAALTADIDGHIVRVSGVTIDISDRKEAEDRQALLAREVDHRARNTLAVVQAIVRLTHASTTPAYVAAVEGRIRALAQTHNLLSKSYWQGADLGQLVAEELAPYRTGSGGKVKVSGPAVFLPPDSAQTIALALHELATNAAKYGALSSRSGEVTVSWKLEPGNLALKWAETGGPAVTTPTSQGFGTKIINGSIKRQIGGKVAFDWRPRGLVCQLSLPYGAKDRARPGGPVGRDEGNLVQLKYGAARRLLLVEDEVLVGMMMRDVLTDMGFFVAGPFCTVAEASSAASSAGFDCAILDVNLGGEPVYPVADLLRDRKVPFIFVTGYDDKGLDPGYVNAPVLQKPIDQTTLKNMLGAMVDGQAGTHGMAPEAAAAEPRDSARMA